jgi:hypothetical protein
MKCPECNYSWSRWAAIDGKKPFRYGEPCPECGIVTEKLEIPKVTVTHALPPELSLDSAISMTMRASEPMAVGDVACLSDQQLAAIAQADIRSPPIGIVGEVEESLDDQDIAPRVSIQNQGTLNVFSCLTPGSIYYLNSGGISGRTLTEYPPTNAGEVVQRIGLALNASTLLIQLGEPVSLL